MSLSSLHPRCPWKRYRRCVYRCKRWPVSNRFTWKTNASNYWIFKLFFFFLVLVFEGKTRICTIGSKTSVSTSLAFCTARMKLICCCLAPLHCSSSFQAFPDYYSYFFISFELLVGVCVFFFFKKGNRSEPMLAKRVNQVDQVVCLPEVELHFSASWNSRKFCALFPIIKIELYLNFQLSDNDLYVRISLSRFYFNLFTRIFSLVLFCFVFFFFLGCINAK